MSFCCNGLDKHSKHGNLTVTGLYKSNLLLLHAVQTGWRLQLGMEGIFWSMAVAVFSGS